MSTGYANTNLLQNGSTPTVVNEGQVRPAIATATATKRANSADYYDLSSDPGARTDLSANPLAKTTWTGYDPNSALAKYGTTKLDSKGNPVAQYIDWSKLDAFGAKDAARDVWTNRSSQTITSNNDGGSTYENLTYTPKKVSDLGNIWTDDYFTKDFANRILQNQGQLNLNEIPKEVRARMGLDPNDNSETSVIFTDPTKPFWGAQGYKKDGGFANWWRDDGQGFARMAAAAAAAYAAGAALAAGGGEAGAAGAGTGGTQGGGAIAYMPGVESLPTMSAMPDFGAVVSPYAGTGAAAGGAGSNISSSLLTDGMPSGNFGTGMQGTVKASGEFSSVATNGMGGAGYSGTGINPGAGALLPSGGFPGAGISPSGALSDGGTLGGGPISTNGAGTGIGNGGAYQGPSTIDKLKDAYDTAKDAYDKYSDIKKAMDALKGNQGYGIGTAATRSSYGGGLLSLGNINADTGGDWKTYMALSPYLKRGGWGEGEYGLGEQFKNGAA